MSAAAADAEPHWKDCLYTTGNSTTLTCSSDVTPYIFNTTTRGRFQIISSIMIGMVLVGSTLNFVVLLATVLDRQFRKVHLNQFLIALTATDFLVASVGLPLVANFYWLLHEGKICCLVNRFSLSTNYMLFLMSISTITFITVQLYLSIVYPFRYTAQINQNLSIPLLVLLNVFWAFAAFLTNFVFTDWWTTFRLLSSAFCMTSYILICCLHLFINREARRIRDCSPTTNPELSNVTHKTWSLAASVLITFGVLYLPYICFSVYVMVNGGLTAYGNTFYEPIVELIGLMKCICNPLLYCFRLKYVRGRILRMMFWYKH